MTHNSCLCVNQVSRQILCSPYLPENLPPLTRFLPFHLTTAKAIVFVWNLRGNIIRTVSYCQRATSSMGKVIEIFHTAQLGFELSFCVFRLRDLSVYFVACSVLPLSIESFSFMFWRWRNKLKWAPFEFLLPSHYWGLGAGSIPLTFIENKKAMQHEGVIFVAGHPLLNRRCTNSQCVSASEMT